MPDREMDNLHEDLADADAPETDEFTGLFISCSSLKDPTSFDGSHHTLEVVTFIDYDDFTARLNKGDKNSKAYIELKERLCNKLLNSLEKVVPGIRKNIVQMQLGTPLTNEHYIQSTKGNVYGTEKGFYQTGPFSFNAKTEIDNLYMCGASIMAHGVAGSAYSGLKTAALILKCKEDDLVKPDETQTVRIYDAEDDASWPAWLHQKMAERKKRLEAERV
jgi:phytoene dehydrogenase-like protein